MAGSLWNLRARSRVGTVQRKSLRENALAMFRANKPGRIEFVDALRVVLIVLLVAHHWVESYVVKHPTEILLPDASISRH